MYDGAEEFWVVVKETGRRQEQQSFEEIEEKTRQAKFKKYMYITHACI